MQKVTDDLRYQNLIKNLMFNSMQLLKLFADVIIWNILLFKNLIFRNKNSGICEDSSN